MTRILLSLVDNLSGIGYLDQSRQTEWAANHVLHQPLDTQSVSRGQMHGLVNAKTAMFPRPHILHGLRFDLALVQVEGKHGFLPGYQQAVHVEFRQFQKIAIRGVNPTRQSWGE